MAWTDASKERFKILWKNQKLSAVTIANTLTEEYGETITRNAVLGMRLRLNLPLRGISAAERAKTFTPRPRANRTHAFAAPPERYLKPEPIPEPKPVLDELVPFNQRRSLLELNDDICRWPIGNPRDPDFFFCGGQTATKLPYCAYHSRIAYQPENLRRDRRKAA